LQDVNVLKNVSFVMKDGAVFKQWNARSSFEFQVSSFKWRPHDREPEGTSRARDAKDFHHKFTKFTRSLLSSA